MKIVNNTLVALALAGIGMSSAHAQSFYIDLGGAGVGNGFLDATNCAACTSDIDQLAFAYQSETLVTLGDATLDVGDSIVTTGGLNVGSFASNKVTSLIPSGAQYGFSSTSFATTDDWGLSFDMTLSGIVAETDGVSVSEVAYSGGIINIFLVKFDGLGNVSETINIMDLSVTGSDASNSSNFIITGTLNFDAVDTQPGFDYTDMFHFEGSACKGDNSFSAIAACPMNIGFSVDQNLDGARVRIGDGTNGIALGEALITGSHDGSLEFVSTVPVPAAVWLFLSGFVGLFGIARRQVV